MEPRRAILLDVDKRSGNYNSGVPTHLRHSFVVGDELGPAISLLSVLFGANATRNASVLIGERARRRCTASARGR